MTLETKYAIGDVLPLFGFHDFKCVVTAIAVRASGQIEYQLEWNEGGSPKSDWFEEKRIGLLERIGEPQ